MDLAVRVEGLRFAYPDGRMALDGISFAVAPGEKVAVVGPNGAGKSTLFLHLNGVLHGENEGRIWVAGLELTPKTLRQVRARVGLVFQDPDDQLFSPTVFEDVAFGPLHMGLPEEEVRRRVAQALAAVGMQGFEDKMPHHLSLGERKRIAIATVLAMEPDILLLDEPSAGLDPRARRNLIQLLHHLPQTMLVASHDIRLVWELCPRTIILDAGRLVMDGPTSVLLQDEALMEAHGLEVPVVAPAFHHGEPLQPAVSAAWK
ncbi:MAG: energy-coupling factor ABC transporter ATP-binding protein [Anaerolineae bacterium]